MEKEVIVKITGTLPEQSRNNLIKAGAKFLKLRDVELVMGLTASEYQKATGSYPNGHSG